MRNGKRRTENGAPLRGDGRRGGGTVEGLPCGADTKDTKDHEDARRVGTADFTDFRQIKGVLAHAGRTIGSLEV